MKITPEWDLTLIKYIQSFLKMQKFEDIFSNLF